MNLCSSSLLLMELRNFSFWQCVAERDELMVLWVGLVEVFIVLYRHACGREGGGVIGTFHHNRIQDLNYGVSCDEMLSRCLRCGVALASCCWVLPSALLGGTIWQEQQLELLCTN